ncbi:unnamed protein product [Somion occarium]|uniref:Anaphase-promoting complex subunit 5 n=1 Tax=Somion occarium TaxID=3059160 RepID=A0ABP1CEF7_9APHY
MSQPNDNLRPFKRIKLDHDMSASTSSMTPSSSLRTVPPPVLLVSLPGLVAHPPNHRYYVLSLQISLDALRKCLCLSALSPEIECRAWTGLAELGMRVIASGFSESEDHLWAKGIEIEVDKALSKGAIIAQKHPSLRPFKHHIALLQAQFSHWQHKTKYARTQIRNLISSFLPTDPPYIVYSAHLAAVSLFTSPQSLTSSSPSTAHIGPVPPASPSSRSSPQDIHAALSVTQDMESHAFKHKHHQVALLAQVLRLRILVAANMWPDVAAAIQRVETALGLSYEPSSTPKARKPSAGSSKDAPKPESETMFIMFEDPFEAAMVVHTLVMSVAYFTHVGTSNEASPRLTHLHALLDSGVLDLFPDGLVQIPLPTGPPLIIQSTHPRILFLLAFLISSAAKRDAVGRKPKRKVFAMEGLAACEKKGVPPPLLLPIWSTLGDVEEVEQRLARIKADLMCELLAVSIMRSEFVEAENTLAQLIAHTRNYHIFPLFSARISLHHAHLAHALGNSARALQCYQVAMEHSEEGDFVHVAAQAGIISLDLAGYSNQLAAESRSSKTDRKGKQREISIEPCVSVVTFLRTCRGKGGTLDAIGHILEACFSSEMLKAKQHLKIALSLASSSQDNHLRALILALIASQYFYTARDHCLSTLQTCEQLAAGLGVPLHKGDGSGGFSGNVHLALWIGRHFLDIHKQSGQQAETLQRSLNNAKLEEALDALKDRGLAGMQS